jgi:hypothetical protein
VLGKVIYVSILVKKLKIITSYDLYFGTNIKMSEIDLSAPKQ